MIMKQIVRATLRSTWLPSMNNRSRMQKESYKKVRELDSYRIIELVLKETGEPVKREE